MTSAGIKAQLLLVGIHYYDVREPESPWLSVLGLFGRASLDTVPWALHSPPRWDRLPARRSCRYGSLPLRENSPTLPTLLLLITHMTHDVAEQQTVAYTVCPKKYASFEIKISQCLGIQ